MKPFISLILIFILSDANAQFRAIMENVKSGNKGIYDVYAAKDRYRYEFTQEGEKMIVIVSPEINKTWVLLPAKKFYLEETCDGVMSRQNDPVQAYITMKKYYTEKDAGKEDVEGFTCDKKEIFADDEKIITAWFALSLNFPLKMVNHMAKDTYMNMRNIREWNPNMELFKVPKGYTQVDERMRPVIPEPPAPDKWETQKVQMPYQGDVSRGALLIIPVKADGHYKMITENKTDKPAKMVRYSFRDGKELPAEVQGPEKYRASRLYPGEKIPGTFVWKAGNEIHIKVFEGTMHLDIHAE